MLRTAVRIIPLDRLGSRFRPVFCCLLLALVFLPGCWRPRGIGLGGRYLDARLELRKPVGNMNKAIENLEYVVSRNPFYRDSLTLLGRAYYRKRRYQDAFQILKRALAVNPKDEIAWILLGLTQLRAGDDQRGLESLKGGLSLLSRVSRDGYRGISFWDKNGLVRSAISRAVFFAAKGLKEKRKLIRMSEILLSRIDDEMVDAKSEEFADTQEP